MSQSVEEMLKSMHSKFDSTKVSKPVTYYFSLGDSDDEKWTLFITADECRYEQGKKTDQADCVVKCSVDFFKKLVFDNYTPGMKDLAAGLLKTSHPRLLRELKTYFGLN